MPLHDAAAARPTATGLRRLLAPMPGPSYTSASGLLRGLLGALASVATATLFGHLIASIPPLPNIALIFVPAIVYAAVKFGFLSALFASVLSVLAYNFQFMEPFGAFGLRGIDDVFTVAVFLAVGAITSDLANQVRRQAVAARDREVHTAALYEFKRAIDRAESPEALARTVVAHIERHFHAAAAFWQTQAAAPGWRLLAGAAHLDPGAGAGGRASGDRVADAALHLPLIGAATTLGTISVSGGPGTASASDQALLRAFASEAAEALRHIAMKQELEAARRLAETARLRAALLNSVTHDFRTPLASILGAATTLIGPGPDFTGEARGTLLATIREEALRLDRFIRNLVDMSRLEAGAIVPNLDWVEVVDVVGAAAQHVRRMRGDIALTIALPESMPMLRLDAVLVEHALVNILDNAVKHSPPGGSIRIAARNTGAAVVLQIDDEGPGVPAADREAIFEKYSHRRSGDRGRAGTGLGLSIARGFVEAQGGRVRATDGPCQGARFEVELPVPPPPAQGMTRP